MQNIVIGFSRPKSGFQPFSWLIRLVTWSAFSHAYIKFYSKTYDRWIIYQASGLKVNFIPQTRFDKVEFIYREFNIPVSKLTMKSTVQGVIDDCGAPYDIRGILGFGIVLLARLFGKKIANPLVTAGSYWCSDLVANILIEIGDADKESIDPSTMSPKDIYNYLIEKGFVPAKQS